MSTTRRPLLTLALWLFLLSIVRAETPPSRPALTVVTLGDSITKGVRTGVGPDETFSAIVERELKAKGVDVHVVNLGVGGERTDQALQRLDAVVGPKPRVVTVMYGTNDSYVDPGKPGPRLSLEDFRKNLRTIVERPAAPGDRAGLDDRSP